MLVFYNKGLVSEDAITVMGVSAKVGDHPIGQFGTGVKYAIAMVLRLGGRVSIYRGKKLLQFGSKKSTIRGQEFGLVYMNGRKLGWTTAIGSHWEPWEGYRELWSNARDEEGGVAEVVGEEYMLFVRTGYTTIVVECRELQQAHQERDKIVLQTEPLVVLPGVEIHPGPSRYIFYRGIRASEIPSDRSSIYTYNLTARHELTEDRKLRWPWMADGAVIRAVQQCASVPVLTSILGQQHVNWDEKDPWETRLSWDSYGEESPSPQFMDVAAALQKNQKLGHHAEKLFNEYRDKLPGYESPYFAELTPTEAHVAQRAVDRLVATGCEDFSGLTAGDFKYKSKMVGSQSDYTAKDGLVVARDLIDLGDEVLAVAMMEALAQRAGGGTQQQLAHFALYRRFATSQMSHEWDRTKRLPYDAVKARADELGVPF